MKKKAQAAIATIAVSISLLATLAMDGCNGQTALPESAVSDQDVTDAYIYLMGRLLVLRQERLDFEKEGFQWNKIIYRDPGGVAWANPNLDVVYSEAWVAVDPNTCVQLEIPKIKGRYYTWHMLNGWGETTLNINPRTFPKKPDGKYAICLKGSPGNAPADALRVDVPSKTSRVLARVELGKDSKEAIRLQHEFKLAPLGEIKVDSFPKEPLFANTALPGAEAFEDTSVVLASEPDINEGMEPLRAKVKAVEAYAKSGPEARQKVDGIIKTKSIPEFMSSAKNLGLSQNGWTRPKQVGNYGSDYVVRSVVNLIGIWANNGNEATYFGSVGNDGSKTYIQTFPKDALPKSKAKYFWSVIVVDSKEFKVIENPLRRYLLNSHSPLKFNPDGSLTLVFAPSKPANKPESNWLPTKPSEDYNLTFRFYGPTPDVTDGTYFPPPLQAQ